MSGAVMNYDFGPKRNWRRWMWNRIHEYVENPRHAVVFYLPGPKDYDRALALSKGFRDQNLIGVERDIAALENLRGDGNLVVKGDFFDAVTELSARREANVIYGDLCSGFSKHYPNLLGAWLCSPYFKDCVFAFNLMRGRDDAKMFGEIWEKYQPIPDVDVRKHRGAILLLTTALMIDEKMSTKYPTICPPLDGQARLDAIGKLAASSKPSFSTYMSESGQVFDSVVFRNFCISPDALDEQRRWYKDARAKQMAAALPTMNKKDIAWVRKMKRTGQSLAAVMAHRTMRTNAERKA